MDPILILDNGAHKIKAGWAHQDDVQTFPNGIFRSKPDKKNYVADQLDTDCNDYSGLVYNLPFEKGILTNWDVEKPVFDRVFEACEVDPATSSLLITEPCFNLPNVAMHYDQMIFEEYEFAAYSRCPSAQFIPYGDLPPSDQDVDGPYDEGALPECVTVVDTGYSFTHITPVLSGQIQWPAVRRVNIGGKLLTNYLKELVSFRQWYMMEDTYVINAAKESCCYVAMDFDRDQDVCKYQPKSNDIVQNYVLPDYSSSSSNRTGYIQSQAQASATGPSNRSPERSKQKGGFAAANKVDAGEEQILTLANERFIVPELLFQPGMIGMQQMGLAEAIANSISALPEELQGLFWANITVVGGNALFPGFKDRLLRDLRTLAPADYFVGVRIPSDPINHAFDCIRHHLNLETLPYSNAQHIRDTFVTRAEYLEHGSNICRRKFATAPLPPDWAPPAATLREADLDEDTEEVSSGHSEEMARKRAKRAIEDLGFAKPRGKKKKDKSEAGFRVKI